MNLNPFAGEDLGLTGQRHGMIPQRETWQIGHERWRAQVTDDGSLTLIDPVTGVAFHSGCGAVSETRHVYLHNSGIEQTLRAGGDARVLEIGLGLGLGLLMTADDAIAGGGHLAYEAIEADLLDARVLSAVIARDRLTSPDLADEFLAWRRSLGDPPPAGEYRWQPHARIDVTLQNDVLRPEDDSVWTKLRGPYDAVFFDPFDPSTNPSLWTETVFRRLCRYVRPAGRLVTYCVSRNVRDAIGRAGWRADRVPGPTGGKREVLVATRLT